MLVGGGGGSGAAAAAASVREQSEAMRQEIVRRAGQLQQVVSGSLDLLKNNGDLIVKRLLEQLNTRLDLAKSKAERILSEPATNEAALRGLAAVNQGLNNLNNIIGNIVARLDLSSAPPLANNSSAARTGTSAADNLQHTLSQSAATAFATANNLIGNNAIKERLSPAQVLDANRLRANLHQLTQHFSNALNATQLQQVLSPLRQRAAPASPLTAPIAGLRRAQPPDSVAVLRSAPPQQQQTPLQVAGVN